MSGTGHPSNFEGGPAARKPDSGRWVFSHEAGLPYDRYENGIWVRESSPGFEFVVSLLDGLGPLITDQHERQGSKPGRGRSTPQILEQARLTGKRGLSGSSLPHIYRDPPRRASLAPGVTLILRGGRRAITCVRGGSPELHVELEELLRFHIPRLLRLLSGIQAAQGYLHHVQTPEFQALLSDPINREILNALVKTPEALLYKELSLQTNNSIPTCRRRAQRLVRAGLAVRVGQRGGLAATETARRLFTK